MSQTLNPDHIIRMRQAMDRIDNQLKRSRQQFVEDITIDNKTSQILNLTITLEDSFDSQEKIGIQSKVTIPQNSIYTHTISNSRENIHAESTPDKQFKNIRLSDRDANPQSNLDYNMKVHRSNSYLRNSNTRQRESQSHESPPRVEKKFQPFSRLQGTILNKQSEKQIASTPKYSPVKYNSYFNIKQGETYERQPNHNQILIVPQQIQSLSFSSNIKADKKLLTKSNVFNEFISDSMANEEPEYINKSINESTPNRRQSHKDYSELVSSDEKYEVKEKNKILPLSLQNQSNDIFQKYNSEHQKSPQVYSYLGQQQKQFHPQINTPLYEQNNSSVNFSFSSLYPSTSEQKIINPSNQQRGAEILLPTKLNFIDPLSTQKKHSQYKKNTSANKNVSPLTHLFKKNSPNRNVIEISTRLHSKSKSKQPIVLNNHILTNSTISPSKKKADALFFERKSTLLKRLATDLKPAKKEHQQFLRQKSKSSYQIKNNRSRSIPRQLSPRIQQISERLYFRSKIKSPCQHYKKYREDDERERFNYLIKQNTFVQKYTTKEEQERIFQALRQSDESVSMWPMKITNYTYAKIKNINQSMYHQEG